MKTTQKEVAYFSLCALYAKSLPYNLQFFLRGGGFSLQRQTISWQDSHRSLQEKEEQTTCWDKYFLDCKGHEEGFTQTKENLFPLFHLHSSTKILQICNHEPDTGKRNGGSIWVMALSEKTCYGIDLLILQRLGDVPLCMKRGWIAGHLKAQWWNQATQQPLLWCDYRTHFLCTSQATFIKWLSSSPLVKGLKLSPSLLWLPLGHSCPEVSLQEGAMSNMLRCRVSILLVCIRTQILPVSWLLGTRLLLVEGEVGMWG